jgi:acetoin utilization deacetylase AcuC-like enzyme
VLNLVYRYRYQSKLAIGREAFRQAIVQRLIPSLRAFNPSLILVSSGFDAADGDVGNCRHQPNTVPVKGMDLKSEDFSWATTEIMKIADICCNGRIVSVLEGGYGEYGAEISSKVATRQSQAATNCEIDAHAVVRDPCLIFQNLFSSILSD